MAVTSTSAVVQTGGALGTHGTRRASPVDGFGDALNMLIEGVEATTKDANAAVDSMLNKTGDVHDAMIALHHAETSLQLTVQIRNKLVQAYQDIMRMPI